MGISALGVLGAEKVSKAVGTADDLKTIANDTAVRSMESSANREMNMQKTILALHNKRQEIMVEAGSAARNVMTKISF